MASVESLIFDIVARDRASDGLSRVSKAADSAAGSTDTLNRRLDDLGKKTARARVELQGDKEAQAALDKIDAKILSLDRRTASPNLKVEGAARAIAEISAVDLELDKLGGKGGSAKAATSAVGAGGLAGPAGMGALIGAGVVLSPIVATLATGLAGFGLAAYGVAKPIENAASKTGGLAANMKLLDPEQRQVALGVLALGQQYDAFQKTLKPEVLSVFAGGLHLAGDLLHDVQPVAVATGKALGVMLDKIDAEFQSQTWQNFFGFMAKEAAPDMQLLTGLFTSLLADLPPLLTGLQPVATEFVTLTTGALNAVGILTQLAGSLDRVGASAVKAAEITSGSTGPGDTLTNPWKDFTNFLGDVTRSIPGASKLVTGLGGGITEAGIAAANAGAAGKGAAKSIDGMGASAGTAAVKVQTLAQQVTSLYNAENNSLSPLLAYTNALIAQRNDADKLSTALKGSSGQVGLNTAAQRNSFSAANTYIQDLLNTSSAAVKSHQGIDAQISSIKQALPLLQNVKGGTRLYWQEVQSLVGWLQRLEGIKSIQEAIIVQAQARWVDKATGTVYTMGGHTARGGYITAGTTPTADDVVVFASRGELVVPADMVAAGAVDHLRGQIPGFASGGIIGSYAGNPGGVPPWGQHNYQATITGITEGVAGAMSKAIIAAAAAQQAMRSLNYLPLGPQGPLSSSAAVAQAFAKSIMFAYGWGAGQWPYLQALWNRESSWNAYAANPTSNARGIPQNINGWSAYAPGDYQAQVRWGDAYIASRYGNPQNAWAHELAYNWYDQGGYLPPGVSIAVNGTGQPEPVGPARGGNTYIINIHAPSGNAADIGRTIARYLGEFKKRGGTVYKPAGF